MSKHHLAGSERRAYRNAHATGPADPRERVEVSVLVRRRPGSDLAAHATAIGAGRARHMTHAEFDEAFGAADEDLATVAFFAHKHGLTELDRHAGRRTMRFAGTVAQCNAAFGVELQNYDYEGGTYRGRVGSISLPDTVHDLVEAVLGLDNRPAASPHFRKKKPKPAPGPTATAAPAGTFTPLDLASLYQFPAGDGAGQCIAIIELGGGYKTADLATYFASVGVTAPPTVTAISVDQATNTPAPGSNSPDGEVMLDIEVAGALAPGTHIAVYFAPNTDAGFLDAITTATHDTANAPSVMSISWGGPESSWTAQATSAYDSAFQAAVALGITVLVASGDSGSTDGVTDGADHVNFPASSPNVTACGGTTLTASSTGIESETVWNDLAGGDGATGGGVSAVFALPVWQQGLVTTTADGTAPLAMRGVPDIAGDADPQTGYQVRVDGQDETIGGTSAVAPLWAGLIARINAITGTKAGLINPLLYKTPAALRDITAGNNGTFLAAAGWDACTGLGSPIGTAVESALSPSPAPAPTS
jgi:kumamolisin